MHDDQRRCQKCGRLTHHEEAWADGQIWCHPCADEVASLVSPPFEIKEFWTEREGYAVQDRKPKTP